jgi:hypothetical protein
MYLMIIVGKYIIYVYNKNKELALTMLKVYLEKKDKKIFTYIKIFIL